jgi:hypothetical protein
MAVTRRDGPILNIMTTNCACRRVPRPRQSIVWRLAAKQVAQPIQTPEEGTREEVIASFASAFSDARLMSDLRELRNRDLVCCVHRFSVMVTCCPSLPMGRA